MERPEGEEAEETGREWMSDEVAVVARQSGEQVWVPDLPSAAEREARAVLCETHRNVCRSCVAGREMAHNAHVVWSDGDLLVIGMDFEYLDDVVNLNLILFAVVLPDETTDSDYACEIPLMIIMR